MSQKRVVNLTELPIKASTHGNKFGAKAGCIGGVIGLKKLGGQYMVVPPGRSAFPSHAHFSNEELYFVIEGEGKYRLGDQTFSVKAGDLMAAPAGGLETAHQLTNTGDKPLRYLVFSTRNDPDVTLYANSGKFMVAAGIPEGGGMLSAEFQFIGRKDSAVDYYDGEDE